MNLTHWGLESSQCGPIAEVERLENVVMECRRGKIAKGQNICFKSSKDVGICVKPRQCLLCDSVEFVDQ